MFASGARASDTIDQFAVYRKHLYSRDELMQGYEAGRPELSLDARIGRFYAEEDQQGRPLLSALAEAAHDACIEEALERFLRRRKVVGIMGSHKTNRNERDYSNALRVGWEFGRRDYCVASGGGLGIMEAANLGAWLSTHSNAALHAALSKLSEVPAYKDDPGKYFETAIAIRQEYEEGAVNLAVPTWLYPHEPISQFATHIAKYFANSIRENGLLALARAGVVYAPGGAGTAQEIFTDAAQNTYSTGERSPMVFLGLAHYQDRYPGLLAAVKEQAASPNKGTPWVDLIHVTDDPVDAVEFILAKDPTKMVEVAGAEAEAEMVHRVRSR